LSLLAGLDVVGAGKGNVAAEQRGSGDAGGKA
jgi:hypothetical protein